MSNPALEEWLLSFISQYGVFAAVVSIFLNVIVAIVGVLPSQPITAVNIVLFGPFFGFVVSWIGESLGAIVGFILYRKGLSKNEKLHNFILRHPHLNKLLSQEGHHAGRNIFLARFIPFIPGLAILVASALSRVTLPLFALYSSLGKIWGLFLEVLLVYYAIKLSSKVPWWVTVLIVVLGLLFGVLFKIWKDRSEEE